MLLQRNYSEKVMIIYNKEQTTKIEAQKADDISTIFNHIFDYLCYASGLIGACLADSFVGKYRTILYIGTMYAFGQAVLAFGAVGNGEAGIKNFSF